MSKPIPQIKKFMTTTPLTVERDTPLTDAADIMSKNQIRHLPVMSQGQIEGILSNTDVNLIKGLSGVEIQKLKVVDCYTPHPYTVKSDAMLDEVLDEMAEKKYGCVLVSDNDHLVGIFTWIDALKATKDLLKTRLK